LYPVADDKASAFGSPVASLEAEGLYVGAQGSAHAEPVDGQADQPPIRVIAEILDRQRVRNSMERILTSDTVASSGGVNLHTPILYYEISPRWKRASACW